MIVVNMVINAKVMADNTILYRVGVIGTEEQNANIGKLKTQIDVLTDSINKTRQTLRGLDVTWKEFMDKRMAEGEHNHAVIAKEWAEYKKVQLAKIDLNTEANKKLTVQLGGELNQRNQLNAQLSQSLKSTTDKVQANTFEEGSIMQLRQALAQATKQYDLMGAAERTAAGGKALETSIQEQMKALSALEQKTGRFQRNVGNYASGFNGLANSINQVTRELPNFAQSATIGFMALSNNLPILADEINRVRAANALLVADGKKGVSVWKQIATSLFSWQSALITLISLSVIYAKELGELFTGVHKLTEEEKALKKQQEELSIKVHETSNAWRVYNGEISSTQAILDNLAFTNNIALDKIAKDTEEKTKEALTWWNTMKNSIKMIFTKGQLFGGARESWREFEQATKEGQDAIDLLLKTQEEERSRDAIEATEKFHKEYEQLQINAIKDDLTRGIKAAEYKRYLAYKDKSYVLASEQDAKNLSIEIEKVYNSELYALTQKQNEKLAKQRKDARDKELMAKKKQDEEDAKFLAGEFDRALEYSTEYYTDLESLVKQSYANGQLSKEEYETEILKLERQRMEDSIRLHKEYNKDLTKVSKEAADIEIGAMGKDSKFEMVKKKGTFSPDISKELEDEAKLRKEARDAAESESIKLATQTSDAIFKIKQDAIDRQNKMELTAIQRNADAQQTILENRLRNGIISEGQYNDDVQRLNQETAARELEANRKAFDENKRLSKLQAVINGALAITAVMANSKDPTGILTAIQVGAVTAATAIQVKSIDAQQYALGGKIKGKSHAQGGVMINAEEDEAVINKQAMRSNQVMSLIGTPSQITSAVNSTYGGVSWESGAITSRPSPTLFSNNTQQKPVTYEEMASLIFGLGATINDKKVILVESDVTKTQKKVKANESNGRFWN